MSILPLRCGNSNRADLQQISASLLQQRGDAITTAPGSIIWIETQAHARAIYSIWAINQKMAYQFDPNKMSDFIHRWETIVGVSSLPTDDFQIRQQRIAAKFAIINKFPTTQAIHDLIAAALNVTFLVLINDPASAAYTQFPGGSAIVGGVQNVVNAPWLSKVHQILIETIHPPYMTDNQFYNTVNQIYNLLNAYLPSYDTFDWFWDSFSDDGYAGSARATISVTVNSTTLTGIGTSWNTPINVDGTKNVVVGSILECYDDIGNWQRLIVSTVNSNTSITLSTPAVSTITSKIYVIEGFFLDCDSTLFPYPPTNSHNLDNAGINSV